MNRVDSVITFNNLKEDDIISIINLKLDELKKKYTGKIDVSNSDKVVSDIVLKSNYDEYGARRIGKIIKDDIESVIANALIENESDVYIKEIGQTV